MIREFWNELLVEFSDVKDQTVLFSQARLRFFLRFVTVVYDYIVVLVDVVLHFLLTVLPDNKSREHHLGEAYGRDYSFLQVVRNYGRKGTISLLGKPIRLAEEGLIVPKHRPIVVILDFGGVVFVV